MKATGDWWTILTLHSQEPKRSQAHSDPCINQSFSLFSVLPLTEAMVDMAGKVSGEREGKSRASHLLQQLLNHFEFKEALKIPVQQALRETRSDFVFLDE